MNTHHINGYSENRFSVFDISEERENNDSSATEATENELDIEPKASLGSSFTSSVATQEMARILLKKANVEELEDQETLTLDHTKRGFSLVRVGQNRKKIKLTDTTGIAEDFRNTHYTSEEVAQRHMWKRLNFFLVMSRYIQEKSPFLQEIDFPQHEKRQFTSQAFSVPPSYTGKDVGYERVHISILNKIIVKQEADLYLMAGPLTLSVKNVKTTVKKFFSLCDIAPTLINSIDGYVEFRLRGRSYALLNSVKNGSEEFADAAYLFASEYGRCLIGLLDRIRDQNITTRSKHPHFNETLKSVVKNTASKEYIEGMLRAIVDFRTRYPIFWHFQNQADLAKYSLYEKIS